MPAFLIEIGSRNTKVLTFQKDLNLWLGHWKKELLDCDGVFGRVTLSALNDFQRNNKLPIEDGVTQKCWDCVEGFAHKNEPDVPTYGEFISEKRNSTRVLSGFEIKTFDCHCGGAYCSKTIVNTKALALLRSLVNHFQGQGKIVTVTSAYRCLIHNRNVGGVSNSRHTVGDAIDVTVNGIGPNAIADVAVSVGFDGVGIYQSGFVHCDTRGYEARW